MNIQYHIFYHLVHQVFVTSHEEASEVHPASYLTNAWEVYLQEQSGYSVNMTTHLPQVPRLGVCSALRLLSIYIHGTAIEYKGNSTMIGLKVRTTDTKPAGAGVKL
jgi:hypothetical protein